MNKTFAHIEKTRYKFPRIEGRMNYIIHTLCNRRFTGERSCAIILEEEKDAFEEFYEFCQKCMLHIKG